MSTTTPVAGSSGTTNTSSTSAATSASAFSSMSSSDFLKIMFTELQNQDPTQPVDTSTIMTQMSNLYNIQSQMSTQSTMQSLVLQDQIASASNLIGKSVTGLDANNNPLSGTVSSVLIQNNKAVLQLSGGQTLNMSSVTSIGA